MTEVTRAEDLIPAVKPAYGAETARVVLDIVRQFPERHLQRFFEATPGDLQVHSAVYDSMGATNPTIGKCGTTRCVAGWTMMVHRGAWNGDEFEAARMLGITNYLDADHLFFGCMNEDKAVAALEYLAKGDRIDWDKLNEVYGE